MPRLSEDKYKKIVSDYLSGMTQEQAGAKNGIGRDAVGNILRRLGISIRDYTGERISNQRWEWDTRFFVKNNYKVAYWAGFLIADGNINDKGNVMALVIQGRDIDHLKHFCRDICLNTDAIFKDKKYDAYGIHLNYKNLGNQLKTWGITPRKSKNFVEPIVSQDQLPHFLRGWIDGDGSVYRYGRSARISVASGNLPSLEWFASALRYLGYDGYIGINKTSSVKYPDNYYLYIGGVNQVSIVADLLLVDNSFCMERKWNKTYEGKRTKVIRICEICGNEFQIDSYRAEQEPTNGRFCSRICFGIHHRS